MTRLAGLLVALLLGATACTDAPPDGSGEPSRQESTSGVPAPSDEGAREAIEELLAERASAIEDGRSRAFAATVAAGAGAAQQRRDYATLQRFPLAEVAYDLGMHDPSVSGDRYLADVEMLVRLDGFDTEPVPTQHRVEFVRTDDGWQVADDEVDRSQVGFAPWLIRGLELYVSDGLLIAFDQGSARHRARFARIAETALDKIAAVVPVDWSERAVVLAPSRAGTLRYEGFDPVEIGNLGGVAFPVRGPDQQVTGRRIVIAPVMLTADDRSLETVLRHELAHVALVEPRDEDVPVWVTEGVAEYAAHQGDDVVYLGTQTIAAAGRGIDQMPPDGLFHRGDWGLSYGIAWFAMQHLAAMRGEDEPYRLLATLRDEEPADFREVSALLEERYGLTTDELAAEAGELIWTTFG